MKLNPKHNNVVIKQQDISEEKHGNIIISDVGKEKPFIGKIIATGPGTYSFSGTLIPMQYKVGDKVAFPSFGGQRLVIGTEEFVIMKDPDILTAIEDEG